ncbi:MAG: ATP-binding protein [Pseudomonadota bacterium]
MNPAIALRFDFSKTESQSFLIHSIRLIFVVLVLFITLSFQYLESRIDAVDVFYPLYTLIGISFGIQLLYIAFFKKLYDNLWITGFLFAFEAFYITGLIYFIGIQQSILIFLYLVNLILAGILFQRKGALSLALWTSILFSFIVSLDTSVAGNTAYLAVGVNNLAFFTVAYLAGYLSEQLNFMGEQLEEKVRDVRTLKNLNDLILKNISSGLLTIDNEGNILQANPSARHILNIQGRSLVSVPLSQIFPELDLDIHPMNKSFDLFLKRQGEKRVVNVLVTVLKDESETQQGLIIRFQDETVLRTLEKRVRQSEKMAAIGQLAAGIAHEIRNPLAGISGSIQLMQGGDDDPEQTQKLMAIVSREIDRLNNLITEFLDFAKPEAPMEDHIVMGDLLEEIIGFASGPYPNVTISKDLGDQLVVLGNRDKLKQAFLNIFVNAFQAMESEESPSLVLSAKRSGSLVVIRVKDNGMGMDEKLRDRIFEPFHTTKHKGTGLGLAITHSIFESHNAGVQVESEVGEGTEFRIQFQGLVDGSEHHS